MNAFSASIQSPIKQVDLWAPIMSDIPDENTRDELIKIGFDP